MSESTKKTAIIASILGAILLLTIGIMFFDYDLKIIKFTSIKSLLGKHKEITEVEGELSAQETEYKNSINKVKQQQTEFNSEKAKYNAISNETIDIIKEATTKENYNIEYMWIRLGNYAKSNNLAIVLAEPGNTIKETPVEGDTKGGTDAQKTDATQDAASTSNSTTDQSTVDNNDEDQEIKSNRKASNSSSDTLFKIQVKGSYLDVSDFIFEVENDKDLRFKLDNISMDYVSGTTIKATFNVKNLTINK